MAASDLQARLRNTESSILFMQQEHAKTLEGLHAEIQKLQQKCADLTFRLAMEETSLDASGDAFQAHDVASEESLRRQAELERLLRKSEEQQRHLEDVVRERENNVRMLTLHLERERDFRKRDLATFADRERTLKTELDARAGRVAFLTAQLHKIKVGAHGGEAALITVQQSALEASPQKSKRAPSSDTLPNAFQRSSQHGLGNDDATPPRGPPSSKVELKPIRTTSANSTSRHVITTGGRRFRQASGKQRDGASPFVRTEESEADEGKRGSIRPTPPVLPPIHNQQKSHDSIGRYNTNNNNSQHLQHQDSNSFQHYNTGEGQAIVFEDLSVLDLTNTSALNTTASDLMKINAASGGHDATPRDSYDALAFAGHHGGAPSGLEGPVLVRKARVRTVNRKDLARHHQGGKSETSDMAMGVLAVDAGDHMTANWARQGQVQNNPSTP